MACPDFARKDEVLKAEKLKAVKEPLSDEEAGRSDAMSNEDTDTSLTDHSGDFSLSSASEDKGPNIIPDPLSLSTTLICPETNEPFQDPIVASDGNTYELSCYTKENIGESIEEGDLYSNRSLKMIIEDALLAENNSLRTNWRLLQFTTKNILSKYLFESSSAEDSIVHENASFPLSDGFYCPITFNIMHDPVIDHEGNTFERVAIEAWIRLHGNSPVTRGAVTTDELRPNSIILKLLQEEKEKSVDDMLPEIARWLEEPAPQPTDAEYGGAADGGATHIISSQAQEYLRQYRRRTARRQIIYNLIGISICILLLKFLHAGN